MRKTILSLIAAGMAGLLLSAGAQPVPDDYASFSQFITARNIFNPSRQPYGNPPHPVGIQPHPQIDGTPGIRLVGTMSYAKGMFAFFDGTSADLSQVLHVGDKIEGYTITKITANCTGLASASQQEPVELKLGDGFRQENNQWLLSKAGELPVGAGAPASADFSSGESTGSTAAPPPSAAGQNDVLKHLMELREKDNQ